MKYIIILGDGMADEPIPEFGNKTPLQQAETLNLDYLAKIGCSGMLDTIPVGFHPGSEIANLSVLGYDLNEVFEGRGVLEAASIGVDISVDEMAMRCNLICIQDGKIKNHSAGHISNEEAGELIRYLDENLGSDKVHFFQGVSYRHLLKMKDADKRIDCKPPHDIMGVDYESMMIRPEVPEASETANNLNGLILKSQKLLKDHPVNLKRIADGKDPANSIWPWSPGYKPKMRTIAELYGIRSGAVISAVDLINGIGVYAGLEVVHVEGATGLYDTNYEGKARAALDALKRHDFVYLHIEASDEAGHEGDAVLKMKTIENLDKRVVKTILEETLKSGEPVTIALLPDHPTPCRIKTHTNDPIPFVIYKPENAPDEVEKYDEFSCREGKYGLLKGNEFIKELFHTEHQSITK
ncbi:MAG: cofactor-independent phosphoglycerate mutase [Dysgonamonadaceae bacterium]|jgi:2,3-bisphosphoglycerate-independent phosphoglycerate mutase|nr:cofactor-independent phosphoglycerate mutase [Dysgonamonadaceae bacterium]